MDNYETQNPVTAQPIPNPAQMPQEKKKSKVGAIFFGILIMFIYLALVSIPQFIVLIPIIFDVIQETGFSDAEAYTACLMQKMTDNASTITIATSVGTVLAVLTVVLWYFFGVYKRNKKFGNVEKVGEKLRNPKAVFFLITGTATAFFMAMLIYMGIANFMSSVMEEYQNTMNSAIGGVEILGFLLTLLLAPIGEETALRGLSLNRNRQSFGLVGCVILSGIFFGIYHMNIVQGLYTIPMGLFFGYVAYKFKSVIPSMICHFLNNLLSLLLGGILDNAYIGLAAMIVFGILTFVLGKNIDFISDDIVHRKA